MPRGLDAEGPPGGGRFGRMLPDVVRRDPGPAAIEALAVALIEADASEENDRIPAGYTYLGQFIDHDLTFDPRSKLERDNDPDALADFRTPRLDLDSVYGSGPDDQPYLYVNGTGGRAGPELLVATPPPGSGLARADLPRNAQGRALVGDPRNDENAIVAQLHLLWLRFHNQVVAHLRETAGATDPQELFEEARRQVRWHYQWVVRHDYLPRVTGCSPARFRREHFRPGRDAFMPVEFSGAAFRFGHSMVRRNYVLNGRGRSLDVLPPHPPPQAEHLSLAGFRPLRAELAIDWPDFFTVAGERAPAMSSMRIDTRIAPPLRTLPPDGAALPRLNLERGRARGVPAGGDVAEALGERRLSAEELQLDIVGDATARRALEEATPLWFYVLREAEAPGVGGTRLGPVGARIVAEVLIGLLEADESSYVRECPRWTPPLAAADGTFDMGRLIRWTLDQEGKDP